MECCGGPVFSVAAVPTTETICEWLFKAGWLGNELNRGAGGSAGWLGDVRETRTIVQ